MSGRDEGFLARWSRRKIESRLADPAPAPEAEAPQAAASQEKSPESASPPAAAAPGSTVRELPALESLTPQSDFAPFMRTGVDPALKGQALKTLFSDPALYPMDGLDVYIDDYSKPDPLPEGWLEKLNQLASLHGEPPAADPATGAPAAQDGPASVEPGTAAQDRSSNSLPASRNAAADGDEAT